MRRFSGSSSKAGLLLLVCSVLGAGSGNVFADVPDYGTMAAAIRSANYPCTHVIHVSSISSNSWNVECNSGRFRVTRDEEGDYSVTKAD